MWFNGVKIFVMKRMRDEEQTLAKQTMHVTNKFKYLGNDSISKHNFLESSKEGEISSK